MKAKIKTMQDLAAAFPDIYRKHKLLCHAQKEAGVRYDKHLKEVTQGDKRCS